MLVSTLKSIASSLVRVMSNCLFLVPQPLPQRGVVALLDKAAGEGVFGGDELMKEWMRDQVEVRSVICRGLQDKRRKAMDVSEQKAATKNFLRSMTQQQQERQMEEALVRIPGRRFRSISLPLQPRRRRQG